MPVLSCSEVIETVLLEFLIAVTTTVAHEFLKFECTERMIVASFVLVGSILQEVLMTIGVFVAVVGSNEFCA
jgi:hypothetical protein